MCVPDVVKKLNVKVFNLMSRTNETRHIEWHKMCKCKCRLDTSFCNNKQRWNEDKCRCECRELIDKGVCNKGFIWNASNCECECDKSCDVGEYLNFEKCKYRNKIVDKLVEECTKTVKEVKLAKIALAEPKSRGGCSSYTICVILAVTPLTISIGIGAYFAYKYMNHWYLKTDAICVKFGTRTQTTI